MWRRSWPFSHILCFLLWHLFQCRNITIFFSFFSTLPLLPSFVAHGCWGENELHSRRWIQYPGGDFGGNPAHDSRWITVDGWPSKGKYFNRLIFIPWNIKEPQHTNSFVVAAQSSNPSYRSLPSLSRLDSHRACCPLQTLDSTPNHGTDALC